MPARLSTSRADVVLSSGEEFDSVTVTTRADTLRIFERRTGRLIVELPDVSAVEMVRRNREWLVRFGGDQTATVTRSAAGCGCA